MPNIERNGRDRDRGDRERGGYDRDRDRPDRDRGAWDGYDRFSQYSRDLERGEHGGRMHDEDRRFEDDRGGRFGHEDDLRSRAGGYDTARGYGGGQSGYGAGYTGGMPHGRGDGSYGREDREMGHRGKGPVGYSRSDERIREDVCDALTDDDRIDASGIEVQVKQGEVTLTGHVPDRRTKRRAEDRIESLSGVKDVTNNLKCVTEPQAAKSGNGHGAHDTEHGAKRGRA